MRPDTSIIGGVLWLFWKWFANICGFMVAEVMIIFRVGLFGSSCFR